MDFNADHNPEEQNGRRRALAKLSDHELLVQTQRRVHRERESLTELLYFFYEISRRRLYSAEKSESMYAFLMDRYKYSKDQAYRRVTAMRLLQELPEIEEKLNSGDVNLSVIGAAHVHFRNEAKHNKAEVPRDEKLEVFEKLSQKSARETEEILVSLATVPPPPKPDRVRRIAGDKVEMKFAAARGVPDMIDRIKGMLAHQNPHLTTGELVEKLCELGLRYWDKAEKKPSNNQARNASKPTSADHSGLKKNQKTDESTPDFATSRKSGGDESSKPESRASVRRSVFKDAGHRCENCKSHYAVEEDHRVPRGKGGPSTKENLRLLCRSCNQRAAIEEYGFQKMDPFINGSADRSRAPH